MTAPPAVSVVMPAHGGAYFEPALESVLTQTFVDFELIVVADRLEARAEAALNRSASADPRIRVAVRSGDRDMAESFNDAVRLARGSLIARMDSDDICHPDRIARQAEVFRRHAQAVVVGTLADGIDPAGRVVRPAEPSRLRRERLFLPCPHSSMMMRRDVFEQVGGYRSATTAWEELDLALRMATHGDVFVLPDVLMHYRYHLDSTSVSRPLDTAAALIQTQRRCLAAYEKGCSYEAILASPDEPPTDGHRAAAFAVSAAHAVWAGARPRRPPHFLRLARSADAPRCRVMIYGLWGAISPRTLRAVLRTWLQARERVAPAVGAHPHQWHFGLSS